MELSDFRMFEPTPYELPDPKTLAGLVVNAVKGVAETYGPVFTVKYIKNALEFEAKKIGEDPPKDIETLDQLLEYIVSKIDKYPAPYCTAQYAQVKTENEFQGRAGAGTRVEIMTVAKEIIGKSSGEERQVDLDDAMSKFRETIAGMKISPKEMGYKKNEDGSVLVLWPECNFMDGCKQAFEEGWLNKVSGKMRCAAGEFVCRYFKILTSYEWDYDVLEHYKPHCIQRCFMI